MKKRIFSTLIAVCVVLSTVSVLALAETSVVAGKTRAAIKTSRPAFSVQTADVKVCEAEEPGERVKPFSNGVAEVTVGTDTASDTHFNTIAAAITNLTAGGTIKLTSSITETVAIPDNALDYTINLNGWTLDAASGATIITHNGTGTLTIVDGASGGKISATGEYGVAINNQSTGKITVSGGTVTSAYKRNDYGTIYLAGGTAGETILEVTGTGAVANTADGAGDGTRGRAIYNKAAGSVVVSGTATVSAIKGTAIYNDDTGAVIVSGGTVSATDGRAIRNLSGLITVSGGLVTSANTDSNFGTISLAGGTAGETILEVTAGTVTNTAGGKAIYNGGAGKVTISGGAVSAIGIAIHNDSTGTVAVSGGLVTSANTFGNFGTISLASGTAGETILEVTAGTVTNTTGGKAIYNGGAGKVTISGGLVTSANTSSNSGTIYLTGGTVGETILNVTAGTVTNTASGGIAIYNAAGGAVTVADAATITPEGAMRPRTNTPATGSATVEISNGTAIYTLSNLYSPAPSRWLVYAGATGDSLAETVAATFSNSELTLSDVAVANYYVSAYDRANGKGISERLTLTVEAAKATLTGTVTISGTLKFGGELTAAVTNSNQSGTLTYQWKSNDTETSTVTEIGTNAATYTTEERDIGTTLTCVVTSSGNAGSITSAPTAVIAKADGSTTAPVVTVSFDGTNANKLMGGTDLMEYSLDGGTSWTLCTDADFDLTAVLSTITATHGIQIRVKATDTHAVGATKTIAITKAATPSVDYTRPTDDVVTGTITMTAAHEYKHSTDSAWTAALDESKTLAAGLYYVRVKAAGTMLASEKQRIALANPALALSIDTAIAAANTAKIGVTISEDEASSVSSGTKFVTSAEMTALTEAIATATAAKDTITTTAEAEAAATALNTAVATFATSIKTGTRVYIGDDSIPVKKPTEPERVETKVEAKVDTDGNLTVDVKNKDITDAIAKAKTTASSITVVLNVSGNETARSVTVNLPKVVQETIINKKIAHTIVVVDSPDIKIGMDLPAVKEINTQAKADVNLTATSMDSGKLIGDAKTAVGARPVFDLKVNYGSDKQVKTFGTGNVSVAVPYTLGAKEEAKNVCAVYVNEDGAVQWLTDSVYDSEAKVLRFSTNHFSTYAVGYRAEKIVFTDTANHWAESDIDFVVGRRLFEGTSATTFSPDMAVTRGMFVTVLGRLSGIDSTKYENTRFTDVSADAYYAPYVAWATGQNVTVGTTATTFAPDQMIARQEMAVFMERYAKAMGYSVTKTNEAVGFADDASVASWAAAAVAFMQQTGVITGKEGNRFDPIGVTTRAETSAILHRYITLVIETQVAAR